MKRLLLDTHAFLWWVEDDPKLSRRARAAIADRDTECWLSLASCWEMAIKVSLRKLRLRRSVEEFVTEQLATNVTRLVEIDLRDVTQVERLPFHHRDPFDRLLVAQAMSRDLAIVSADPVFRRYGVQRLW